MSIGLVITLLVIAIYFIYLGVLLVKSNQKKVSSLYFITALISAALSLVISISGYSVLF